MSVKLSFSHARARTHSDRTCIEGAIFKILTEVSLRICVFWDIRQWGRASCSWCFKGAYCLHLKGPGDPRIPTQNMWNHSSNNIASYPQKTSVHIEGVQEQSTEGGLQTSYSCRTVQHNAWIDGGLVSGKFPSSHTNSGKQLTKHSIKQSQPQCFLVNGNLRPNGLRKVQKNVENKITEYEVAQSVPLTFLCLLNENTAVAQTYVRTEAAFP